jgi:hypothetical protein
VPDDVALKYAHDMNQALLKKQRGSKLGMLRLLLITASLYDARLLILQSITGTGSRTRTGTPFRAADFESAASTDSAIPAI